MGITTNKYGTLFGRIDSKGNFSVTPERFCESNSGINKLGLICNSSKDGWVNNKAELTVNQGLTFKLIDMGKILSEPDEISVIWEVCNAGEGLDDKHHEIYYKQEDDIGGKYSFYRDLSFRGTHLLRCRVKNKRKKYDQTMIFVIHGF